MPGTPKIYRYVDDGFKKMDVLWPWSPKFCEALAVLASGYTAEFCRLVETDAELLDEMVDCMGDKFGNFMDGQSEGRIFGPSWWDVQHEEDGTQTVRLQTFQWLEKQLKFKHLLSDRRAMYLWFYTVLLHHTFGKQTPYFSEMMRDCRPIGCDLSLLSKRKRNMV